MPWPAYNLLRDLRINHRLLSFEEFTMSQSQTTTDHAVIKKWIESRKGRPSVVKATHGKGQGNAGLLRIDFAEPDEALEEVNWEDFFDTFDEHGLAFLYQENTASGRKSRFSKFISRDTAQQSSASRPDGDARKSRAPTRAMKSQSARGR
jgi:hypothetical protein